MGQRGGTGRSDCDGFPCANTTTTSGLYIAGQNLVNSSTPPTIVSLSYGQCEAENGASWNASQNSLYQQAVTEGNFYICCLGGAQGAASCDAGWHPMRRMVFRSAASLRLLTTSRWAGRISVTHTAALPISTGVRPTPSTYGSALSYIPEIPWNDSCAGALLA